MKEAHVVMGILALALVGAAGIVGAWCWWKARSSAWFWRVLRAGQAAVVLEVVLGGVLVAIGRKLPNLHLIYGLLPLAVSFIAEQLRVASAQMVLDSRGYDSAQEVGRLPENEQRGVVLAIVQREVGVMTIAAIVMVVLLVRAAGTA